MRVNFDNSGFNIIKEALKDSYKTRVGLLGSDGSKDRDGLTNAEIGRIHEFGSITRNIPRRSWLRKPLEDHLMSWVKSHTEEYKQCMEKGDLKKWYSMLGIEAERIIGEAFESGYDWKPLSPITIARKKGSDKILIDTSQLRRSVSSKVLGAKE